jgi:hypothetical protein
MLNYLFRQVTIPLMIDSDVVVCDLLFCSCRYQREKKMRFCTETICYLLVLQLLHVCYTNSLQRPDESPSLSTIYFLPLTGALALPFGLTGLINLSLLKSLTWSSSSPLSDSASGIGSSSYMCQNAILESRPIWLTPRLTSKTSSLSAAGP